jgi:hypothetical protein
VNFPRLILFAMFSADSSRRPNLPAMLGGKQEAFMSEGYVRQLDEKLVQIEADLQRYDEWLADAKLWSRHPSPEGFERMNNVPIIESVIAELKRLHALYSSERANAYRP